MLKETLILDRHDGFIDIRVLYFGIGNIDTVNILTSGELSNDSTVAVINEGSLYGVGHRDIRDRKTVRRGNIADQHTAAETADKKSDAKKQDQQGLHDCEAGLHDLDIPVSVMCGTGRLSFQTGTELIRQGGVFRSTGDSGAFLSGSGRFCPGTVIDLIA